MENNVAILPENKIRQIFAEELEAILTRRIPAIVRQANRKEYLTTSEVEELTGLSSRLQAYHRTEGNLPFSQEGRKIIYKTCDVERFIEERRIVI